ncbi:flagellar motor switch protein FliM [Sphingomonas sp. LB-2]|uniref:flagellar motor switch protein FliM n=1 Tax=Sphingomonas caeni TaxID=2984949 RepID=UPI002232226F|nr:flagellar motor switch protein FliM [Sphingomonas caeni]MCW3846926.1 flagellar motor switch protein FliM [Sphingomonas caeni]
MVNSPSETDASERRERPRASADHAPALGASALNPFGDLITMQHLSARLSKSLKAVFEGLLRKELRAWAEPLSVQRYADYKTERGPGLSTWASLAMTPGKGRALIVMDGKFVLEMLDCFFGGDGEAPHPLPEEFSPAAEALVARVSGMLAGPLESAWEPLTRIGFKPVGSMSQAAPDLGGDDPVVVTRFGLAEGEHKPVFIDILYPVAALKPHTVALNAKVHDKPIEVEPQWRSGLTRAVMGVPLQVRSVLAEPVVPLAQLLELKAGDVIPIDFGPEVPVMVASRRLGTGLVGTSNGRAAVRLTSFEPISAEDFR